MCKGTDKVIVAMSGGVDSSVAAGLLARRGYDVTGVFMCLGAAGGVDVDSRGCCSPQDAADARRVADKLGIPLYVLDFSDEFQRIVSYFAEEYARGRTPNPCILCNTLIKFGSLVAHADRLGVAYVATGHYARIIDRAAGAAIARGRAAQKDQSYALFGIDRECLSRILLPVGELADKNTVREMARELDLNVHDKPDSQEICFAPDTDYVAVLRRFAPEALQPGKIVNAAGETLGEHDGFARFTIGQRRGLRVAAAEAMYVTHIDPATATVTIGPREQLLTSRLTADRANWHGEVAGGFDATVQIRYNHAGVRARVRITGEDSFAVDFAEPVSAVTPGQAAVVYDGDILLGGGWIE